jgi:hypothetical protein
MSLDTFIDLGMELIRISIEFIPKIIEFAENDSNGHKYSIESKNTATVLIED